MKVCMLSHSLYESDTRILQYTRALIERGDSVDVIALRAAGLPRTEVMNGVHVYRVLRRRKNARRPLEYLLQILQFMLIATFVLGRRQLSRKYDLVHVHSVPDFLVFAAIVPRLLGARIILDIHDILPEFYASKFSLSADSPLFRGLLLCERISAGFADHVIAANEIWRDRLLARSIPAGKCTAIRNYPDPNIFAPAQSRRREGNFRILYPGTLNRHQGVDLAIRAFARVAAQMPGAEFLIYGEGPEKPALIALCEELGMTKAVRIRDFVPVAQIAAIMADADLAVAPKRISSGFGNEAASTKIMEFMSLGVPVIVSRTRIDSLYHDDSMVKFVEPENEEALAEAMLQLWRNPAERSRLAGAGLRYVREHSWAQARADYFQIVDGQRAVDCSVPDEARV
jgi:glycosyltransferase involved in cell wall biosynthesis